MSNKKEILCEQIKQLKHRIITAEKEGIKLSETDTRQGLINPIFNALGWDFSDFLSVKSELRYGKYNDPIDYAFFSSSDKKKPILLLEAKSLGTNLNDPKVVKQLCMYLGEAGVQWGVLSDGNKYVMYNSKSGDSFDEQKFLTLQIKDADTEDGMPLEELADKLTALLSRECLENDDIQRTYEDHMVNTQIEDAIESLLSAPFDTLANAIRKEFKQERVKAGMKVSTKKIISYLEQIADEEGRLPIEMDRESITTDEDIMSTVAHSEDGEQVSKSFSKKTKRVTIFDLMEDGHVREGDNWRFEYKGEVFWGRITGNAELEIDGKIFDNPSKAGLYCKKKPCSGWTAWEFRDNNGHWVQVERLRKAYRETHGISKITRQRNEKAAA